MRALFLAAVLALPAIAGAQVVQFGVPGVRVVGAPPPVRVEVATARPSPNHVWVAGHWAWRGNQHVWMPGHWMMAPGSGYTYEQARWEQQNGAWVFIEGHWRAPAPQPTAYYEPPAPVEVVANAEPPAPIVETRPAMPFAGAVWMPGYWHWNGHHHVWIGGRWSAARAGWTWEPHHWVRTPAGWRMEHGHWRR